MNKIARRIEKLEDAANIKPRQPINIFPIYVCPKKGALHARGWRYENNDILRMAEETDDNLEGRAIEAAVVIDGGRVHARIFEPLE